MSTKDFYRAFEERHRGARALITQRLEVYQPFIAPLAQLYSPAAAIDLGCGRGEWLELLIKEGFTAQGVDLDEGMLAACRERGLPAMHGNAIGHLKTLADASQSVVSGFHFAEHIVFNDLETLVIESMRVLKPGGLLILETPNPENLVVGTSGFYLDPTHVRPLPPLLLSFLPEHHGFERVKILRLQEAPDLHDEHKKVELMQVLDGVSPDYSVVAQKFAPVEILANFDAAFSARYGVELHELASRHDTAHAGQLASFEQRLGATEAQAAGITNALARISELHDRLIQATTEAARSAAKIEVLQTQCDNSEQKRKAAEHETAAVEAHTQQQQARITQLEAEVDHWKPQAEQRAAERDIAQTEIQQQRALVEQLHAQAHSRQQQIDALDVERTALRTSWSWRVTSPLRWGARAVLERVQIPPSGASQLTASAAKALERPLTEAMRVVLNQPVLAYRINQRLLRVPALHDRLLGMAQRAGVMPSEPPRIALHETGGDGGGAQDYLNLTSYGREIHDCLTTALRKRQQEQS